MSEIIQIHAGYKWIKTFQEYLQHKIKQTFSQAHKNMFDIDAAVRRFTV